MILKTFSPKNFAKILAFFAQTTATFCKNLIITLVFEKNAIFSPEIGKNRKNCYHNIGPRLIFAKIAQKCILFQIFSCGKK
jgi:hypothetical protein